MSVQFLEYELFDGYVHNWLVAGPQALPLPGAEAAGDEKARYEEFARQMYATEPGVTEMPVDRDGFTAGETSLTWQYYRCHEDHLVDVSTYAVLPQYLRAWAYTRLNASTPGPVQLLLSARGPADVWLNGKLVYRKEDFGGLRPVSIQVDLEPENELLVRFEGAGWRETLLQMALRLAGLPGEPVPDEIQVRVPTHARFPHRQLKFERLLEKAYLEEVVNTRGSHINLHWAEDADEELRYAYQVQDAQERIYVEGTWDIDPKEPLDVGHPQRIFERPFWVVLKAPGKEYYEQNMRYERRLPLMILDNRYSTAPYGTYAKRRREALEDAARREGDLFAEIAKMALEKWEKVDPGVLQAAFAQVRRGEAGSEALLVGMLGMVCRYADAPGFPVGMEDAVLESILSFRFEAEPWTESQAILLSTGAILAGQRYPERVFNAAGQTGQELRQGAETRALDWLRSHGQGGFLEWDSNYTFEANILALTHLASLAESQTLRELAAVLLDKMLFLMAVNSFQGAFGATQGRACAGMLKSAQLEATSGVVRMLWGTGVFNGHLQGTVSLATADYEFPTFFSEMAAHPARQMWSRERHVADAQGGADGAEVNKVAYKTEDYLLGSAQDYRPGQAGRAEHIWQATMGPDAVVFATHPACMSDDEAHLPGFWLGNATLPRVAQWKDVLVAVHKLPEDDWMGFTHAYFPTFAFDEWALEGGWAFARKGKAYLAITARQGLELIKRGPDGYRELRSYGRENIWLCHMGRDDVDGYFSTFQRDILKIRPEWEALQVRFTSLRKDTLAFGWAGPLLLNGKEQPITGFKHIENPYCTVDQPAKQMDITYGEVVLRLNFE